MKPVPLAGGPGYEERLPVFCGARTTFQIVSRMPCIESRQGIGQVVFSPLSQGILTGKYKPGQPPQAGTRAADPNLNTFMHDLMHEKTLTAVQHLQTLAQQGGYSLPQMALAWVLRKQIVSAAIIGATRPQQVEENAKAGEITLTDDILHHIDEILGEEVTYTP